MRNCIDTFLETARAALPWAYGALAVLGTAVYGFKCLRIFPVTPTPACGWPTWHQYWFNGVGAVLGWLAGWVVLDRWLLCTNCSHEPTGWTVLLAVIAFVGITGNLPTTLMHGIAAMRAVLERYFGRG